MKRRPTPRRTGKMNRRQLVQAIHDAREAQVPLPTFAADQLSSRHYDPLYLEKLTAVFEVPTDRRANYSQDDVDRGTRAKAKEIGVALYEQGFLDVRVRPDRMPYDRAEVHVILRTIKPRADVKW